MRFVSLLLSCSLVPAVAIASMGPIPGEDKFAAITGDQPNSAGAELGFAGIDEDFFLKLTLHSALNLGKVGIGFQIPLNLRVVDRDPQNNDDYYGLIRREDWDETSEWLKVIRYVRFGHKHSDELLFVRVGELAAEIGHGTIMTRYLNNLDINTFRVGTQLDINTNYGGVETVVGDIGSLVSDTPESRIVGGRAFFKPYSLVDPEGLLNIFSVGVTVITDLNAPRELEMVDAHDKSGALLTNADGTPKQAAAADQDGNLKIASTGSATVWGLDADAQVLNTSMLKLTPYTDLNFISGGGWGWHAGMLFMFRLPIGFELNMPVRLEYRRFRNDYVPSYFSTMYEIERYTYPVGGAQCNGSDLLRPKNSCIRERSSKGGLNGVYGDLAFDFAGILQIGAVYEGYNGAHPDLAAFLSVPALEVFQFKAYYNKTAVDGLDDMFTLDNRSLLIAEARYELITFVYLVGRFTRRWAFDADASAAGKAPFQPSDDWQVGIEASFTF